MYYDISHRNLIDSKPLQIRFDKIDRLIGICDETKYLTLLISDKNMTLFTAELDIL